jgi:hypothetical protein
MIFKISITLLALTTLINPNKNMAFQTIKDLLLILIVLKIIIIFRLKAILIMRKIIITKRKLALINNNKHLLWEILKEDCFSKIPKFKDKSIKKLKNIDNNWRFKCKKT